MISRLFTQLEIDNGGPVTKNPRPSVTKQTPQKQQQQQAAMPSALQVKKLKPEEKEKEMNLKSVIERLRQLEDELTKRNSQQKSNPNETLKVLRLVLMLNILLHKFISYFNFVLHLWKMLIFFMLNSRISLYHDL